MDAFSDKIRKLMIGQATNTWDGFKTLDPSYQSAATPSACSEECDHCSEQFLPKLGKCVPFIKPIKLHSDEQARSEINGLISTIDSNLTRLRIAIEENGDAILTRWKKRSQSKREALLQKADASLYSKQGAENDFMTMMIDAHTSGTMPNVSPVDNWFRDEERALTPYLNFSTLREEPLKLLALMHYRTQADPSEWIVFDCKQMRSAFREGYLDTAYNPHCVVAFGHCFGQLVQWDQDSAHKWDVTGYAAARLALKAQCKLTNLLHKISEYLLEDLTQAATGHIAWDTLAKQDFKQADADGTVWTYPNSAFSAAPKFDVQHLIELFTTRRNAAEDELWLLQTDPLHLRSLMDRFNDSTLSQQLSPQHKSQHLSQSILGNIRRLTDWDILLNEANRISTLGVKLKKPMVPGKVLPKEYEDSISLLEETLKTVFDSQIKALTMSCAVLPSFRHHLTTTNNGDFKTIKRSHEIFRDDFLFFNIAEMKLHAHQLSHYPSYHLATIDGILAQSKKERERIDQVVLDHLSDIAAVEEALTSIRYHRSRQFRDPRKLGGDSAKGMVDVVQAEVIEHNVTLNSKGAEKAWERLEGFCNLPMPSGKITRQDLSRMSALYDALQSYWQEVRNGKGRLLRAVPKSDGVEAAYIAKISIGIAEEQKAKMQEELDIFLRLIEKRESEQELARDQELAREQELARARTVASTSTQVYSPKGKVEVITPQIGPKLKVKTRPQEVLAQRIDKLSMTDNSTASEESTAQVAVDSKNIGIFQKMFSRFTTGMTKWNQLVAALRDAGFSATSNGGSAVSFKDQKTAKGSIVFHRPHPDSRIGPDLLRGFGKRLNKWFGWDEDTFVVRSK